MPNLSCFEGDKTKININIMTMYWLINSAPTQLNIKGFLEIIKQFKDLHPNT